MRLNNQVKYHLTNSEISRQFLKGKCQIHIDPQSKFQKSFHNICKAEIRKVKLIKRSNIGKRKNSSNGTIMSRKKISTNKTIEVFRFFVLFFEKTNSSKSISFQQQKN